MPSRSKTNSIPASIEERPEFFGPMPTVELADDLARLDPLFIEMEYPRDGAPVVVSNVRRITRSTSASPMPRGVPGRGSSSNPSRRWRESTTVEGLCPEKCP